MVMQGTLQGEGDREERRVTLLGSPLISLSITLFSTSCCAQSGERDLPSAASIRMSPPSSIPALVDRGTMDAGRASL